MQALAIEAFKSLVASLVWPALLHSLWIGLLVASVVALLMQSCERLSHHARYRWLLAALLVTTLGPAVAIWIQHAVAIRSEKSPRNDSVITAVVGAAAPGLSERETLQIPEIVYLPNSLSRASYIAFANRNLAKFADDLRHVHVLVVAVWLLGVLLSGGLLAIGTRVVHRMRHEADPVSAPVRARAQSLARRLGLRTLPAILVHPQIDEPFLTGLFQPAILLPARWLSLSRDDLLDAILAHELAHARRLDQLVNLAQRVMEAILFFHPAVHWLSRSLRRQREFCTDHLAVRVTRNPLAMASALESVALLRLSSRPPRLVGASLGGETTSLLPRIQELIGMKPSRPRTQFWPFFAIPVAGLIALVAATAGLAQYRRADSSIQSISGPAKEARPDPAAPKIVSPTLTYQQSDRQICYEVRIISLEAEPWRDLLKDRLKLVKQEADVCAWIIDDEAFKDLLNLAQADTRSNVLHAPKVTSFENSTATIFREEKQHFVSQVEKIVRADIAGFQPIVTAIDVGARIELKGAIQPGLTKLTADLRDRQLVAMHTLHRRDRVGDKVLAAEYQVPSTIYRQCKVVCDIPDDSRLVISMGLRQPWTEASNAASGLLKLVGLGPASGRTILFEQLFVIKPRHIVLEADERPVDTSRKTRAKSGNG